MKPCPYGCGHTYLDYLHDIHEAARKANAFSRGLTVETFVADEKSSGSG